MPNFWANPAEFPKMYFFDKRLKNLAGFLRRQLTENRILMVGNLGG